MCAESNGKGSSRSTSSPGDSPVSQSVPPASSSPRMMNDGCGLSSPAAFAWYDRASSSWRMFQVCLFEGLATYSETWPTAGTMRNGRVFQRQPLVRRTSGGGSFSSPSAEGHQALYPTPTAERYGSSGNGQGNNVQSRGRMSLETMAKKNLWPTPTAGDGQMSGSRNLEGSSAHSGVSLTDAVRYGNSSTKRDGAGGMLNHRWVAWLMGLPTSWVDAE